MTISTHLLAATIGILFPLYLILTHKKDINKLENEEGFRKTYYKRLIFIFWSLASLVLANSMVEDSYKLNFDPTFNTIGLTALVLISLFIIALIYTSGINSMEKVHSIQRKLKDITHFLPTSKAEYYWFNLLSISAGICEEVIFRLFMFSYFLHQFNLWIAFILTNVFFALTHFDTQKQNMMNSFLLGLLFSGIYYFSQNIWLAILLHIIIDVHIGYLGFNVNKFIENNPPELNPSNE